MGIKVDFVLYGDTFPVHELANKLQIRDLVLEKKGQIRHIGLNSTEERMAECTSLMYETGYIDTIDIDVPLDVIYTIISPNVDIIKKYINKYQLSAKFVIVINLSENPIMSLSAKFIHLANELCAEVEFDSYITQKSKLIWWK